MLAHHYSEDFYITTDQSQISLGDVMRLLKLTHWACNRPAEVVKKSMENAMCFGVYNHQELIGFARVVSDHATFAYICDVIIDPNYRGQQLGHWLIKSILNHPELKEVPQWRLKTTFAHRFYKTLGFEEVKHPDKHLELCGDY